MDKLTRTATLVRNHYIRHFRSEYEKLKNEAYVNMPKMEAEIQKPMVLCELESSSLGRILKSKDIIYKIDPGKTKHYRHDLVTLYKNRPMETYLCWPVLENYAEDKIYDDIPWFTSYTITINDKEVVVNPFAWYNCDIIIYPEAEPVKGILDFWFFKWYFRKTMPNPFLGVIHSLSGPYHEQQEGDLYMTDLGTAPVIAFTSLIYNLCRKEIKRIEIK